VCLNVCALLFLASELADMLSYQTFLNLLDGSSCSQLGKTELLFSEAPILLAHGFATHIASSPDKAKVAIAYGAPTGAIQFGPDSRTLYAGSIHLRQWDISGVY
jgi:hypothetical protein